MDGSYARITFWGVPAPTPTTPSALARRAAFDALARETFDLLVVGGGITGAGVARDAAMRGLRTALVEQDDFASGTSSRSSRLVHGGVRYLEHGQLRLVFESSHERRTLRRIAPHLVRPLAFIWPVYAGARVARWKLAAGLALYDALATFRNFARHERLDMRGVLQREPRLRGEGLRGGARYWDALTDDARLTLATVRSAIGKGAVAVNHARVTELLRDGAGRVSGARVSDLLTGTHAAVSARVVVNATGPWSDATERLAGAATSPAVRGSKGVHLSIPRLRIGNEAALTLLAPRDGRVMFVLPAGDFAIVGTTDSYDDVSPHEVRASVADVDYLLEAANHFFPRAALTRDDVVAAWAGLRPLVARDDDADPGDASREHAVSERVPGLVRVTGGKLTTYRVMARDTVDAAQRSLGGRPTRSRTGHAPLAGGAIADPSREIGAATSLTHDAAVATRLVHAHGDEWREVWRLAESSPTLAARLEPSRPYLVAELRHAVERELACTLGDLLIRRTPLAFEMADHGRAAARRIAPSCAEWLGWSEDRAQLAVAEYEAEVERMFGIDGR